LPATALRREVLAGRDGDFAAVFFRAGVFEVLPFPVDVSDLGFLGTVSS
jgi:hypothetical protein